MSRNSKFNKIKIVSIWLLTTTTAKISKHKTQWSCKSDLQTFEVANNANICIAVALDTETNRQGQNFPDLENKSSFKHATPNLTNHIRVFVAMQSRRERQHLVWRAYNFRQKKNER